MYCYTRSVNNSMLDCNKLLMLSLISMSSKKGWLGITKLQKLAFLLEHRISEDGKRAFDYEFFMYDLGPISTGVYNDFEFLMNEELIIENEDGIRLSELGEVLNKQFLSMMPKEICATMEHIVNEYAAMRTDDLVGMVHKARIKLPNGCLTRIENVPKNLTLLPRPGATIFKIGKDYMETFLILSDEPLTEALRQARRKGTKSKPYEPLTSS